LGRRSRTCRPAWVRERAERDGRRPRHGGQNLKNDLSAEQAGQQALQDKAAKALRQVEAERAALDAKFAEAQAVMRDLEAKKAEAAELVSKLEKKYERELAALTGLNFYADAVLQVCPVGEPHAVYDGFGAPRGRRYHPHAGNDINAAGTPIFATFDGNAVRGATRRRQLGDVYVGRARTTRTW
jgi:murein DD-endopeptidase MepM/ murein hydrolase activator NlpD